MLALDLSTPSVEFRPPTPGEVAIDDTFDFIRLSLPTWANEPFFAERAVDSLGVTLSTGDRLDLVDSVRLWIGNELLPRFPYLSGYSFRSWNFDRHLANALEGIGHHGSNLAEEIRSRKAPRTIDRGAFLQGRAEVFRYFFGDESGVIPALRLAAEAILEATREGFSE